ncbi:hypothetical protein FHS79_000865 [Polymorphobacter multimanifer]|uniref:Ice-binding protein C-terminal domain-containing protein n=1 Tax=Polymorphobacter multimanifer TaxID=1070431 RepID=A0A841L221_9SPHN|nr:hypothetical protein [Polymorphobacter multimanifer]
MTMHWRAAALALMVAGAAPASALTIIGTAAPGFGGLANFSRELPFYRTGTLNVELKVTGGNAMLSDGNLFANYITFYDFFDPETGEPQGGNDTITEDVRYLDAIFDPVSGSWKASFFVQRFIPYVSQNPGDPFPYETGYTVSEAGAVGSFLADAPITYTLRLTGSAMVPEPASWAMLIAGFGLVGAAARRRRRRGFHAPA